ncbi:MAG: LPS biosynthesis protein WbpP, partial [Acidobacteriaceae bacterium]|nr:LPS biosynthesis protein WbpP [Acidobacteriaceae bacterium]
LNELWHTLEGIEGVTIPVKYVPPREGDVLHSQADTTAARNELGHDPQYTFEQGLRRTLAWYRADRAVEISAC